MKKFVIVIISIFLLLLSFALGFYVKKHIDDKKISNWNAERKYLQDKINHLTETNYKLSKSVDHMKTEFDKKWLQLTEDIYLDKKSITKNKYSISGWFKIFNSVENPLYDVDGVSVNYELIKYEAGCNVNVLCLIHIKQYDRNGKLLTDEINNYGICPDYSGFVNGEIYYNALCKYEKDKK